MKLAAYLFRQNNSFTMRYLITIYLCIGLLQGCDILKKDSNYTPLIPEGTPFIVGVLEATQDTVHHYPEVYVGYLSQPKGFEAENVWTTEGIWWPVTNALVTRPVTRMDLKRVPDTEAKVTIRGPLNHSMVRTVQFTHEGKGVYGDNNYDLSLVGGEKYRLSVIMGDSRRYTAITTIPKLFEWKVPGSVTLDLKLNRDYSGVYNEKNKNPALFPFSVSPNVGYIVDQKNSEYDYYNFDVREGSFLFDNRSYFLRAGAAYGLYDASDFPDKRAFELIWRGSANKPLRNFEKWWLSLSQLNIPLSRFYYPIFRFVGNEADGRFYQQDENRLEVVVKHESSYLFDYMSNIQKVGENGEILPETDAFGVFGAYSAAYRKLTIYPERSWDPDTLNWGDQGN